MEYRETQEENDLFYTCSLIEYIARKTHNQKKDVISVIGIDGVKKIYELADILHCENIEKVVYEHIENYNIEDGIFDYKKDYIYKIPSSFDIGRVYQRLILGVAQEKKQDYIQTLFEVFNSWIIDKLDNFNSDLYYLNPDYIFACYLEGKILEY